MALNLHWGAVDLHMAMHWMALNSRAILCGRKEMGGRMFSWILLRLTRLFWTDRSFAQQHFYDSFALVSQICARRDALVLFGLNDDELLPDLHITRAGTLRAGMGAHLEHVVNQDAQAADRQKVPAEVIQAAPHEVDTDSDKDESIVATSGSEGSEGASESEQNDPPSSLASDAEQYERLLFIWLRKWLLSFDPDPFFFELTPCALEAQTVIKTFCLR